MTRKNLSLLKRSNERGNKPLNQDGAESTLTQKKREPSKPPVDHSEDAPVVGKLFTPREELDYGWKPATSAVLKLLFSLRLSAAIWSGISDCDETYNYWEPLHMLLYGDGFQTWEYSPIYAIRSYFYIYLHMVPASLIRSFIPPSKVAIFIALRCMIGCVCMAAEYSLYSAACKRLSLSIGRLFIIFSMLSTGMFISSAAFLPSSFAMICNTFAMAAYLRENWFYAILCTCMSAFIGWPFAAILGLPIVIDMLILRRRRLASQFFFYSALTAFGVGGSIISVDSYYYGKRVFAPLNIVLYNVLSGPGPELYGTEPLSYYLKNLLLNWNFLAPISLLAVPFAYWHYSQIFNAPKEGKVLGFPTSFAFWRRFVPVVTITLSMLGWLLVFFTRPHKEERFLFPIYTLIALLAAIAIDSLERAVRHWKNISISSLTYLFITIFALISFSRVFALHKNFAGQMDVYKSLNEHFIEEQTKLDFTQRNDPLRVCVGKEWYRFPSSFFLPPQALDKRNRKRGVQLRFIQSEFKALLPKPWAQGKVPDITRMIPSEMNDQNMEEASRYVPIESCDYLVDLETPETTQLEPNYGTQHSIWRPLAAHQYLLAAHSHWFYRAFFVPHLSTKHCQFGRYTLYQRIPPTIRDKN